METGPWLKVSSGRLVKPGIEPGTPGLQGKQFIHYNTAAPTQFNESDNNLTGISKLKLYVVKAK